MYVTVRTCRDCGHVEKIKKTQPEGKSIASATSQSFDLVANIYQDITNETQLSTAQVLRVLDDLRTQVENELVAQDCAGGVPSIKVGTLHAIVQDSVLAAVVEEERPQPSTTTQIPDMPSRARAFPGHAMSAAAGSERRRTSMSDMDEDSLNGYMAVLQDDEVALTLPEVDLMSSPDIYAVLDEGANSSVAGGVWMRNTEQKLHRLGFEAPWMSSEAKTFNGLDSTTSTLGTRRIPFSILLFDLDRSGKGKAYEGDEPELSGRNLVSGLLDVHVLPESNNAPLLLSQFAQCRLGLVKNMRDFTCTILRDNIEMHVPLARAKGSNLLCINLSTGLKHRSVLPKGVRKLSTTSANGPVVLPRNKKVRSHERQDDRNEPYNERPRDDSPTLEGRLKGGEIGFTDGLVNSDPANLVSSDSPAGSGDLLDLGSDILHTAARSTTLPGEAETSGGSLSPDLLPDTTSPDTSANMAASRAAGTRTTVFIGSVGVRINSWASQWKAYADGQKQYDSEAKRAALELVRSVFGAHVPSNASLFVCDLAAVSDPAPITNHIGRNPAVLERVAHAPAVVNALAGLRTWVAKSSRPSTSCLFALPRGIVLWPLVSWLQLSSTLSAILRSYMQVVTTAGHLCARVSAGVQPAAGSRPILLQRLQRS